VITTAGRDLDRRTGVFGPLIVMGGLFGYLVAVAWAMEYSSYNIWAGLAVIPVLLAMSIPLIRRLARREANPAMTRLIVVALVLKLGGGFVRFAVSHDLYGGAGDGVLYAKAGAELARSFRQGVVGDLGPLAGTNFIKIITGMVFVFTGPTQLGGYLVFSWLAFWGLYLFYRAFIVGCPDGDHRLYGRLVFFLPSLIYWPSSIGKEAWMTLTLGVTVYGTARLYRHLPGGYALILLGMAGSGAVRPHVALVVLAAVAFGSILHRPARGSVAGLVGKLIGLGILAGATLVLVPHLESFLQVERIDATSLTQVLDRTERLSQKNGATFAAPRPTSPADFPLAAVSVVFRPFPWEAHNVQALVASIESCFLGFVMVRRRRSLRHLRSAFRTTSFAGFAVGYSLLFVLLLSTFGNFGILARERVQVLPMILVLIALAPAATAEPSPRSGTNRAFARS
jgi:hypothetical protein